jgi:hypothetical protein
MQGVADLVNGVIDILVDIAIIKRHSGPGTAYAYGSCSLCMKNHLGTFINAGTGTPSATGLHNITAICDINKHPAVLGGDPVRQQLCIVDGLLANGNGAGGSFDTRVDRMIMGTFAPIVDYLTAMRIMKDVMGKPDANNNLPKFLTNFDYAETDALDWNEYVPGSGTVVPTGGSGGSSGAGGSRTGGTSGAGGARTGGTSGAGGAASGGTTGSGGARSGGTTGTGGARSDGTTGTGGARSDGTTGTGGAAGGGTTAEGGTTSAGTTSGSAGAGGTGGLATSATSATGGSKATGGTSAGSGTTASSVGGSGGSTETTDATAAPGKSGGGCTVAGTDHRATPWGAMLAFGAVVAGRLRRWLGN